MSSNPTRSPARLLAPVALLVFALAVSLVVLGSGGADDGSRNAGTAEQRTAETGRTPAPGRRGKPSLYTVKRNDTLGKIAEQTGVKVEVLQTLNPEVDPQALVAGQKIKLRE